MTKDDLLFCYGTLRPGNGQSLAQFQGGSRHIGKDRINGLLYNIGWYPGALDMNPGPFNKDEPVIIGDVFQLPTDWMARQIDQYESYPDLFDRLEVTTERGLRVWVYEYQHDVKYTWRIESGDWMQRPVIRNDIVQIG